MRSLLHLSDVHFGPKHLPEVARGVETLVVERRPDLVVISGDLTQRAKPQQFREARAFAERLRQTAPVLAVPGNHDVPLYRFWERLLAPFGAYRRHFAGDLEPVFRDPELAVAGLNSAHGWGVKGGWLRRSSVARARVAFAAAPDTAFRIAVVHHHLARPTGVSCEHPAWGARRALSALAAAGVEVVLSGHLHRCLAMTPLGPGRAPLQLLSGTSTSSRGRGPERGRNSLQWLEVEGEAWRFSRELWDPTRSRFETVHTESVARRASAGPSG